MRRRWPRPVFPRGGDRTVVAVLAAAVAVIGLLLLRTIWVVFQHAYLNSYWFVPGSRVGNAYWGAVGFAVRGTVLVVALIAACLALAVAVLRSRARKR